jgi:hypothetical protein
MGTQRNVIRVLPISAASAWRRYLELTQDVDGPLYREVEQIAWEELQESLARLPGQRAGAA